MIDVNYNITDDITETLVNTITYCVDKAVSQANYNKTSDLQYQILSYNNENYSYKIQYGESIITAYALDNSIVYPVGSFVKLLTPNNDSSSIKYILGENSNSGFSLNSSDITIDGQSLKNFIKNTIKEYNADVQKAVNQWNDQVEMDVIHNNRMNEILDLLQDEELTEEERETLYNEYRTLLNQE